MYRGWLLVVFFSAIVILSISIQLTIAQNIVAIERVTNGVDGQVPLHQRPSISADGRYIVYESTSKNIACNYTSDHDISNIFLFDNETNTAECVSVDPAGHPGDGSFQHPMISADGRYVAFDSDATVS
jgi:Tol biopolymer transport system component